MQRRQFIERLVQQGAIGSTALWANGCGTLLHRERCNQPHSHQIDWKIAALDGLGLLLFFVPGVIAFVVDFWTGAIYLPASCCPECNAPGYQPPPGSPPPPYEPRPEPVPLTPSSQRQPAPRQTPDFALHRVPVPREQLQPRRIEQVVAQHTGRTVSLNEGPARLSRLAHLDRFSQQVLRHETDRQFGYRVRSFFARLMNA